MKQLNLLSAGLAIVLLVVTGCKKEIPLTGTSAAEELQTKSSIAGKPSTQLSLQPATNLRNLRSSLPAGYQKRLPQKTSILMLRHPEYRDIAFKALGLESSSCDANTSLNQWLAASSRTLEFDEWLAGIARRGEARRRAGPHRHEDRHRRGADGGGCNWVRLHPQYRAGQPRDRSVPQPARPVGTDGHRRCADPDAGVQRV